MLVSSAASADRLIRNVDLIKKSTRTFLKPASTINNTLDILSLYAKISFIFSI